MMMNFDRMHDLITESRELGDLDTANELQSQMDEEILRLEFLR